MRVTCGFQPTGQLHWGNYFGAVRPAVELQREHDVFCSIANLQAVSQPGRPDQLESTTFELAIDLFALGFDPSRAVLYFQSDISEISELVYLLSTVAPVDVLRSCRFYREKLSVGVSESAALLAAPLFVVADALACDCDRVLVGADQLDQVALAAQIAEEYNRRFGDVFVVPAPQVTVPLELPSLGGDGGMSKHASGAVDVFSDTHSLRSRISQIREPEVALASYTLFANGDEYRLLDARHVNGDADLETMQEALLGQAENFFSEARKRRAMLREYPAPVADALIDGTRKVRRTAASVLARAKRAMGLSTASLLPTWARVYPLSVFERYPEFDELQEAARTRGTDPLSTRLEGGAPAERPSRQEPAMTAAWESTRAPNVAPESPTASEKPGR